MSYGRASRKTTGKTTHKRLDKNHDFYENRNYELSRKIIKFSIMFFSQIQIMKDVCKRP